MLVDHDLGAGVVPGHVPGASGVVEVDVGHRDRGQVRSPHAQRVQGAPDHGSGRSGARLDQAGTAAANQVSRRDAVVPGHLRVDLEDVVPEIGDLRRAGRAGRAGRSLVHPGRPASGPGGPGYVQRAWRCLRVLTAPGRGATDVSLTGDPRNTCPADGDPATATHTMSPARQVRGIARTSSRWSAPTDASRAGRGCRGRRRAGGGSRTRGRAATTARATRRPSASTRARPRGSRRDAQHHAASAAATARAWDRGMGPAARPGPDGWAATTPRRAASSGVSRTGPASLRRRIPAGPGLPTPTSSWAAATGRRCC